MNRYASQRGFSLRRCFCSFLFVLALCLSAGRVFADGMIIIPRPPGGGPQTPFQMEVKYHHVQVDITGQVAKTRVEQEFFNPTGSRLEGTYLFPLPEGATISDFAMDVNGKMTEAELLDAGKAKIIYEDIVRRMRDPALLEYSGKGAFRARIFPLEPHSGKKIRISYTQPLTADNRVLEYTYPLNTEKFSTKPLDEVSIRVNLRAGAKIKTIFCPTHQVEITRHGDDRAVVGFEARDVKPDTDFTLYFSADEKEIGMSLLTYKPSGEDGFFFLGITPAYEETKNAAVPKDIAFVLDTSGSMAGKKMEQARKALLFCVENLNTGDRFELVRFSTEAENLFGSLAAADRANRERAMKFIENLKPIGGTNVEDALARAADVFKGDSKRPKIIVFITDGKPTIGATDEETLVRKISGFTSGNVRVFTFGIGDDVNTHLLDRITEASRAYRTYVRSGEDIEVKVSSFYEKIKSPVLVDLKLNFGSGLRVFKTYPKELPDLFHGSQLMVFGRYSGKGDSAITLEGSVDGKKRTFTYRAHFDGGNEKASFIAPLWASQRTGFLLDEIRLHGEQQELKEEVIDLARRYGIITPYTSYLIVEDEKERVVRNDLREEHQTLGAVSRRAPALEKELKDEYLAMRKKSGADSVTASQEVENLKQAANKAEIRQGQSRLAYTDRDGNVQNLASQNRIVGGRAFYQTGTFWNDSRIQSLKNQQARRIQFAGAEYFSLLAKYPSSAQYLALGRNVRLALDNTLYEIYE